MCANKFKIYLADINAFPESWPVSAYDQEEDSIRFHNTKRLSRHPLRHKMVLQQQGL